jgi:hypothetical protein
VQLCEKFDIQRVKKKVAESVAKTLDDLEVQEAEINDREAVILQFVEKLIQDHSKALKQEAADVYSLSLDKYKVHLKELEQRDIQTLKKQLNEMKRIKQDLERDFD